MIRDKSCKKCRRAGEKLFLKGERCNSPKCAMVKRNYPPGVHGQKGYARLSSYGLHLKEKQKVKNIYGLTENQLRLYMKKALRKKGDSGQIFLQTLERRLDSIIFRLGLARSRTQARQLISHGHFLLNNRKVNIPSHLVKANDLITVNEKSIKNKFFQEIIKSLEKYKGPPWLSLDKKNLKAKVLEVPGGEDLNLGIEAQLIVEYYAK